MTAPPQRNPGSHVHPTDPVQLPPLDLLVRTAHALAQWELEQRTSGGDVATVDRRWLDCHHDPNQLTAQSATLILNFHRHSRLCLLQLAALAYLTNPYADEYE